MTKNNNKEAFLALVRAGLWKEVNDNENLNENHFKGIDWGGVQELAEEQSVVGLIAAGVDKLPAGTFFTESNLNQRSSVPFQGIPLTEKLTLLGKCQLIEQRNQAMNSFLAELEQRLHEAGIKAVLVKGQGIAQCYTKPLWRSSGDVDLLLDEENYKIAKELLLPMASEAGKEFEYDQHQSLTIGSYTVELHGSQRCGLSCRMDEVIDEVQRDVCENGKVRTWINGNVPINLPAPDEDVILVFTHFLKHFYKGGISLRQICDWCRLLLSYRETINLSLLEFRLRKMRLVSEWKAFGAFAVERLGMPIEAMPLFNENENPNDNLCKKAKMIEDFVMMSGNFRHNRDHNAFGLSYLTKKTRSMRRRINDSIHHAKIFPLDSLRFMPSIMIQGLKSAARGE